MSEGSKLVARNSVSTPGSTLIIELRMSDTERALKKRRKRRKRKQYDDMGMGRGDHAGMRAHTDA